MQQSRVYTSYNLFFLIPFLLWFLSGGVALFLYDKQLLFSYVNTNYSLYGDIAMYYITKMGESIFIIPLLISLPFVFKQLRTWKYLSAALLGNIGAFLLSQSLKSIYNEPRPLNFFQEAKWIHMADHWERYFHRSFPSGHTTGAFAAFCFLSLFLAPRHKWWGAIFFLLAVLVAYSRLYLAAHFFLDVYVGSIIGTFFSILAVRIFYKTPSQGIMHYRNLHS